MNYSDVSNAIRRLDALVRRSDAFSHELFRKIISELKTTRGFPEDTILLQHHEETSESDRDLPVFEAVGTNDAGITGGQVKLLIKNISAEVHEVTVGVRIELHFTDADAAVAITGSNHRRSSTLSGDSPSDAFASEVTDMICDYIIEVVDSMGRDPNKIHDIGFHRLQRA
jgi:hypothetical protein